MTENLLILTDREEVAEIDSIWMEPDGPALSRETSNARIASCYEPINPISRSRISYKGGFLLLLGHPGQVFPAVIDPQEDDARSLLPEVDADQCPLLAVDALRTITTTSVLPHLMTAEDTSLIRLRLLGEVGTETRVTTVAMMTVEATRPAAAMEVAMEAVTVAVVMVAPRRATVDTVEVAVTEAADTEVIATEDLLPEEAVMVAVAVRPRKDDTKGNEEQRQTTTCLYVGNLPYSYREEDISDLFDRYGRLRSVSVPTDRFTGRNKGFAFVTFEDRRDAEDAKNKYDEHPIEGRRLKIDWDIGADKKDEIKSVVRPPRAAPADAAPSDDFGRDRGRSPPPSAGRRSPQYSPYRKRSPSPYSSARHP
ncbi:hypothetical protein PhCBS80983_g04732 [Powellomyces hirtus]|uniref:RRM domain-containing protein n=1 Tax=Powellomyces hirtus TaxID=109895 RepID=A0A507DYC4_9FUNG|nr:hypothetical protein PhCBS80983_g04732 [Powellomyces hirtus]